MKSAPKIDLSKVVSNPVTWYVAGGVIALVIIYLIWSDIKSFFSPETVHQGTGGGEEGPGLDTNPDKLTYPLDQYDIWADRIYEAFNYTGSDWGAVIEIFRQMETADDVKELINSYGVRTLYIFAIPTAPLNLPQTLQREDSFPWHGVEDVNEILTEKGINIQF
jgi:hypothetical protein